MSRNAELKFQCKVIGLVRRWAGERCEWLLHKVAGQQTCKLIEAERLEKESFRLALNRELAWVLPLTPDKDYIISSVPRLHFRHVLEKVTCSGEIEVIQFLTEFYLVDLYGVSAEQTLNTSSRFMWVGSQELTQGTWNDLLHPDVVYHLESGQLKLLEMSQVISPWEGTSNW